MPKERVKLATGSIVEGEAVQDAPVIVEPAVAPVTPIAEPLDDGRGPVDHLRTAYADARAAAELRRQNAVAVANHDHVNDPDRHALGRPIDEIDATFKVEMNTIAVQFGFNPV